MTILLFFWLLLQRPVVATAQDIEPIGLSKFSAATSTDIVEICNISDNPVDLSNYKLSDTTSDIKTFTCTINANSCFSTSVSNRLNDAGDTIFLKKDGSVIDSVVYCDQGCDIPIQGSLCVYLANTVWTPSSDSMYCSFASNSNCPLPTLPPIPTDTPTPTSTTAPTATHTPFPSNTSTPTPVLSLSITLLPSTVNIDHSFTISFSLQHAKPQTMYYIKAFGGINDDLSLETLNNDSWHHYQSSWTAMPKFITNDSGDLSQNITAKIKSGKPAGDYHVQIKLKEVDGSFEKVSPMTYLPASIAPTSTPAPSATHTPTPTLSPSPIPTLPPLPTIDPSLEDITQQSSASATALSSDILTTPTPKDEILGISDIVNPQPHTPKNSLSLPSLPLVLIALGGLLLFIPLIISKIR